METMKVCQSCGMPMGDTDEMYGANSDGTKNVDYCKYCFVDGHFNKEDETMEEMIETCIPFMVDEGMETLCDNMVKTEVDKARYYHIIHSESVRLERLISDMLELSRLQSGKLAFAKSFFSGSKMMSEIIAKFSILADDMDIQFYVSDNAIKLPAMFSNKDRIMQVMNILLDNAFKFCGDAGTVFIDATVTSKKVKISVTNSGEVIPQDDLPFVFDRFYKSEKSHSKSGSGLGLPIAKEILSNLGEEITVKSEQGANTVFTFTVQI